MRTRLRYVELRSLDDVTTAVGTFDRRWCRLPLPIGAVTEVLRALDPDADMAGSAAAPDGALAAGLDDELVAELTDLLRRRGSILPVAGECAGTPVALAPVVLTGDPKLCGRLRAVTGSRLLAAEPVQGGLREAGGAQSGDDRPALILVAATDPDAARQAGEQIGPKQAWVLFHLECGRGWFGPVLRPGGAVQLADLLARRAAADAAPAGSGLPVRLGSLAEPGDPELAWMAAVMVADLSRHLAGEECLALDHQLELDPATLSVRRHPVLPLPVATAAHPGSPPLRRQPSDLIDDRTGIVTRVVHVAHHASIPPRLLAVHAHIANMQRIAPWFTDSVSAGTSFFSETEAEQAAIGEAVERYCGNIVQPSLLRLASWRELVADGQHAVDPDKLVLFSARQHATPGFPFVPMTRDLRMHWVRGRSLTAQRPAWLPACLVYANWFAGPYIDCPHTNNPFYPGLAGGPNLEFALASGIQEIIERHATMAWWANRQPLPSVRPTHDLAELWHGSPQAAGQRAWLIPLDNEFGVPVMAGFVEHPGEQLLTVGFGARPDPEQAALKAYAEALTLQEGARDLLRPDGGYRQSVARGEVNGTHMKPWRQDRRYLSDYRRDFRDVVDLMCQLQIYLDPRSADHVREWIETPQLRNFDDLPRLRDFSVGTYQEAVERQGYEIYYADVTTRDVAATGMRVVRALIPGLIPNFAAALPFQGLGRLRQVAVDLGWRAEPLAEDQINVFPMPHA